MIHIKDNHYIDADGAQFILTEKATVKEGKNAGKAEFRTIGYYSSIPSALTAYINMICREKVHGNHYTLNEAVQMFKDMETETRELFERLTVKEAS